MNKISVLTYSHSLSESPPPPPPQDISLSHPDSCINSLLGIFASNFAFLQSIIHMQVRVIFQERKDYFFLNFKTILLEYS